MSTTPNPRGLLGAKILFALIHLLFAYGVIAFFVALKRTFSHSCISWYGVGLLISLAVISWGFFYRKENLETVSKRVLVSLFPWAAPASEIVLGMGLHAVFLFWISAVVGTNLRIWNALERNYPSLQHSDWKFIIFMFGILGIGVWSAGAIYFIKAIYLPIRDSRSGLKDSVS